jgi:NAD(P)-dependent dehydrogenase (short-subunit alcohol dehydrogenase family)
VTVGSDLLGKVALVTGGGRGIGLAIALAMAEAGADVAVTYLHTEAGAREAVAKIEALGRKGLSLRADLSKVKDTREAVKAVAEGFGRIDILVNNAAVFSSVPWHEITEELWDTIHNVNLKGLFFCSQEAAHIMMAQGGGAIINLASGGGLSPYPGYDVSVAYAASKAGVVMVTRRLAWELAPKVRVNAIAPGIVDSKPDPMPHETVTRLSGRVPMRRLGTPGEIARVAVFLASESASYITGQVLSVDGGVVMK